MTPSEIKETRLALGLTQTKFGSLLCATDRTVRMWETGKRNMARPTQELLNRILAGSFKKHTGE